MSKTKKELPTSVRLTDEDAEQFEVLKAKLSNFSYSQLRRAAIRLGATLLEIEPEALTMAQYPKKERRNWLLTKLLKMEH